MTPPRFHRLVVALDASPQSVRALGVAVSLAARLEAELKGLHVLDAELAKLAELPLVREIDFFSGEPRPIRAKGVERQLALYAGRARTSLEHAVRGLEIRWSFETARGRPHDRLLELAGETDLVVVGVRGRSYGRGLGSTARTLLERRGLPLMIVDREPRAGKGDVCVIHDGTEAADEAVALGAALLRRGGPGELVVIDAVPRDREGGTGSASEDPGAERRAERGEAHGEERRVAALTHHLRERIREAGSDAGLRVRQARGPSPALGPLLAEERPALLIAPRSALREPDTALPAILKHGRCPVVVVG